MLELTTYTELEIAHRLVTSYAQKCRHLHGHRYEVEITVTSKHRGLNKDGMIVDFKKLKEIVKGVLDEAWDHGACFNAADPLAPALMSDYETARLHIVDANPTLEWMVGTWANDLQIAFDAARLDLTLGRLKASETAKNTVTWTRDCGGEPAVDPDKPKKTWANVPIQGGRDARVERPKMELKDAPEIARPEVAVAASKPEDELHDDEEAYLVSYWPVGYPQPVSGVFATAMRGIALVRTLKAAVEARHPNGVTLIGFNRVPR